MDNMPEIDIPMTERMAMTVNTITVAWDYLCAERRGIESSVQYRTINTGLSILQKQILELSRETRTASNGIEAAHRKEKGNDAIKKRKR